MLDLGSGSGILALAAVKLGAARAIGIENDPEANVVAARNASRNGVEDAVEFLDGDAGDLAPLLGPADLVLSNILRSANTALLPAIARALRRRRHRHLLRDGGGRGAAVPAGARIGGVHGPRGADRHGVVGCRRATEMIRVLVERSSGAAGRRGSLLEGEAHHLRVRRAEDGETVELRDGEGLIGLGRLVRVGKELGGGRDRGRSGVAARRS